MMGNTYAHVIEQSEKEWMKQVNEYLWSMWLCFIEDVYISLRISQNRDHEFLF